MISPKIFVPLIALVLLNVQSGHSLSCYTCDSSKGITCNYGFLSIFQGTTECQLNSGNSFLDNVASLLPSNCVKLVGKDHEGNTYTARGCAPASGMVCQAMSKLLQFADSRELQELDCFTCNTDNCNSATTLGVGAVSFLIALLTASFVFIF